MSRVNIFTRYEQRENHYTNGFVSLLRLAPLGHPQLLNRLLNDELGLPGGYNPVNFLVLKGIDGYADGEVSGADFCIWFETKIGARALNANQIRQHLTFLDKKKETRQYLVLLTPDDSNSGDIKNLLEIDPRRLRHLEWRRLFDLLEPPAEGDTNTLFSALADQFREHIEKTIREQDTVGGILKISFGDTSGVYEGAYLDEMKAGKWLSWNTPRKYQSLDGTRRMLLLYDPKQKGVTVEVEIEKVVETGSEPGYPWTNTFAPGTMRFFDPPIPLEHIKSLGQFQDFGVHRKDRNAFRNLTREQYHLLVGQLT
jgi:hypothetical protein